MTPVYTLFAITEVTVLSVFFIMIVSLYIFHYIYVGPLSNLCFFL